MMWQWFYIAYAFANIYFYASSSFRQRVTHGLLGVLGVAYDVKIWFKPTIFVLRLKRCMKTTSTFFQMLLSVVNWSLSRLNSAFKAQMLYLADCLLRRYTFWSTKLMAWSLKLSETTVVSFFFKLSQCSSLSASLLLWTRYQEVLHILEASCYY